MNSTSTSIIVLNSTSTRSGQSGISSNTTTSGSSAVTSSTTSTTTNSTQTTNSTSTLAATSNSTQTTTSSTSSDASSTTINSADPGVTQNDIVTTTTVTASTTRYGKHTKTLGSGEGYSISFFPPYWLCTDVQVTFTGPLIESGFYGDTLQFQYFQYSPSYPSILTPIFTDSGLTVTSDTVNYWINYIEYAPVNFAYMPNIAVKVVDVTPKSNGYTPGLIFMQLTNITPEGYQSCQNAPPAPIPEFQAEWIIIIISAALGLVFLQAHKRKIQS